MKVGTIIPIKHNKWTSGRLNTKYFDDYAQYFVKWIQAMEEEGFSIYAITPQNEPLNGGNSMSLKMGYEDERDFIKLSLGPYFKANNIKTKIYIYDHNYNYDDVSSEKQYPLKIYEDADAAQYITGSAWHNYGGDVSELDTIHSTREDKRILFTESSIGTWNYDWDERIIEDFRSIFLGTINRYGEGVILWNLMLDENKGPNRPKGCTTCYGAVDINSANYSYDSILRRSHYYDLAEMSKVVRPNARRVWTSGTVAGVENTAFANEDGSLAFACVNPGQSDVTVGIDDGARKIELSVPARSVVTARWNPADALKRAVAEVSIAPPKPHLHTSPGPVIAIVALAAIAVAGIAIGVRRLVARCRANHDVPINQDPLVQ